MSEGGIRYISLQSAYVRDAVRLYTQAFQATRTSEYSDGSVLLKIYNANVLVTPGPLSSNSVVELLTDRKCLRNIRQNRHFTEIDLVEGERYAAKTRDTFGVFWMLTVYQEEDADIYQHIEPCKMCNKDRHIPATCDEMARWTYYLENPFFINQDARATTALVSYRRLQAGMSSLRNRRFQYASEDIDQFINVKELRPLFDELERIMSFLQALVVALYLNPTMIYLGKLSYMKGKVEEKLKNVLDSIPSANSFHMDTHSRELFSARSDLADAFRQLVKRLQSGRMTMYKELLGLKNEDHWVPNPQEAYILDVLFNDVDYWRHQKFLQM
ncbi:hypothetical protein HA466_0297870 [Hirschfeldia incana]|nr:hypothetical protein HA466_0297870 [Hirschfeldia incana]